MKHRTFMCTTLALALAASGMADGSVLAAQDTGLVSDSPWRWRWTPLRPIAGLGLPAPVATLAPRALELPHPVIGLAWSAQNPAGLADDLGEEFTQVSLAAHGVQGGYRLATSPARSSSLIADYGGWRRLSIRSAVIGRVAVERTSQDAGNRSVLLAPDLSSPFVPTDTNAPATLRTRVTLEGGQGVTLGRWRLGIAFGYEGTADNVQRSSIAVVRRAASGGVSVGVARALGEKGRVGVSARRLSHSETVNIFPNPGAVRLYLLDGFLNVNPQDYLLEGNPFFRRADRLGNALGLEASGTFGSAAWTLWAHRERSDERQIALVATNVPVQRWGTRGYDVGLGAHRAFSEVLATVLATGTIQRGVTVRAPASMRQFEAEASRFTVLSDVRWKPSRSPWGVAALLQAGRQRQQATDRAARTSSDIAAWSPAVTVEVSRAASSRWSYGAGLGLGYYIPFATIPSITARGDSYLTLLAPAFEVAAAPARTSALSFTSRWQRATNAIVMRTAWSTTSATRRPLDAYYLPTGQRGDWTVSLSVFPGGFARTHGDEKVAGR